VSDLPGHRPPHVARTIAVTPLMTASADIWQPPTDVYETENEIIVKIDIAGVEEGDMEVTIEDDVLRVRGYRTDCSAFSKSAVHRMEIYCGEFETYVRLPHAVNRDADIECVYRLGMLTIELQKEAAHTVRVRTDD
jgi:HSP20 family protein